MKILLTKSNNMGKQIKKLMERSLMILFFLALVSIQYDAYAQKKLMGKITDENDEPLTGANVYIESTEKGTTSDFEGKFSITVSSGDVLVISFVSYATQKITIDNQTTINVKLLPNAKLDEVVVIGYGTAKKSDLAGSVSQVATKSFEDAPVVRVESALQGRASGVSVAGGGQPGDAIKVRIRGINSITGDNNPLVVVDGVFGGDLKSINPNDISSIEILKDASALAIYGSRGSNGVILVTTKKGRGGKAKFTVNQFVTVSSFAKNINKLNSAEFAEFKNQESIAAGNVAIFTEQQIANLRANPIDWEKLITQTGIGYNTQLSMSGSSKNINYFISGNYLENAGTLINTKYQRGSLRANLGVDVNDRLSIGLNLYGSREYTLNNLDAFEIANGSILLRAITWNPASPLRDENGKYIYKTDYANDGWNPVYSLQETKDEVLGNRMNATLNGSYQFNDSWTYSLIGSTKSFNSNRESIRWEKDPALGEGSDFNFIDFVNFKSTSHQISNVLNWKKTIDEHNLDVTGVYEFQGTRTTINRYNAGSLNVPRFYLGDDGSSEFFNNDGAQSAIESYLGRLQYNFRNTIFFTSSLRVDSSSKFVKEKRTGYFPSVAVAYKLPNLNGKYLTSLKFRGGWGQVGNENVSAQAAYSLTNNSNLYSYNGETAVTGQTLTQIGNPDLTWETTTQLNVGIDFGLFKQIRGTVDFYQKTTKDLLLKTTITGTSLSKFENVGEVLNRGFDISLSGDIIQNENFSWNAAFNLSILKNEITSLKENLNRIPGNNSAIGGTNNKVNVFQVGQPIATFSGYTYLGVWKTSEAAEAEKHKLKPGDAKHLRDADGNLVLGPIGNGIPTTTWGFNNTLTYKNWDLNIFINAASGFEVYNFVAAGLNGGTSAFRDNLSETRRNEWTSENETDIPRRGATNLLTSSRWVEDGSFIRLSNLKLGYNFNDKIKGIEKLEIYVSGQNLFLLTSYSGYDPEVSSTPFRLNVNETTTQDQSAGLDQGSYPNPRSYTVGVKLNF